MVNILSKPKKKRQMTEEQKQAAVERLAKAREKRMAAAGGPKSVHPSVLSLPEDHPFSYNSVKSWIKENKDFLPHLKRQVKDGVKGSVNKQMKIEQFIRDCEYYIKTGDWISLFYGQQAQSLTQWKCVRPAYHHDGKYKGLMKRTVGVFYNDTGLWTEEMDREYYK